MSIIIHLIWLFLRISLSLCVVVPNICMRADKISSAMCWNIYLYDHSLPIWSAHLFRIRIIAIACAVHLLPRIPCIFESNSIFSRTNSILMDPFSTNQFNLEPRTFSRDSFHFCVCVCIKNTRPRKKAYHSGKKERKSHKNRKLNWIHINFLFPAIKMYDNLNMKCARVPITYNDDLCVRNANVCDWCMLVCRWKLWYAERVRERVNCWQ